MIMRKRAARILLAAAVAASPLSAHAISTGSVVRGVVSGITSWASSFMLGPFSVMLNNSLSTLGSGIQGEINKGAVAQKNTVEAVATYEAQERLNARAAELNEKMRQPTTTCSSMAMGNQLGKVDAKVKVATSSHSRAATESLLNSGSVAANALRSYDNSMTRYCTPADEALGRCKVSKIPNANLSGGDVRADLMFSAADNPASSTYTNGQGEAVRDFIKRITGSYAPEAIATRDPQLEKTPQGKAYVDLSRRYAAFMSMSNYSLNAIAQAHEAEPGLGDRTMMSARTGKDASMMAVLKAYVDEKFSPKSMADQARQTQAEVILRDMAQTNAFRLWMEYQNLTQTQRIEAMNAAQLSLLTEAQLKPQLAAQMAATTR